MELYILRHGMAEEISQSGRDRDRQLTEEGREKTRAAGKALRKLDITFDRVLASPFARAWQTAEIVVQELGIQNTLQACEALSSGAPLKDLFSEVQKASKHFSSVLAVGHEPDLSRLISVLLSGAPDVHVTMKKGALAKLSCATLEPGGAALEWLLGPKHLSRIA